MKIDTKKCTSVSQDSTVKVNTNKYVDYEQKQSKSYGRWLAYLPSVIMTPVLVSSRTPKTAEMNTDGTESGTASSRRKLLQQNDLDELNKKLEDLYVGKDEEKVADDEDADDEDYVVNEDDNSNDDTSVGSVNAFFYNDDDLGQFVRLADDEGSDACLDRDCHDFDLVDDKEIADLRKNGYESKKTPLGRISQTAYSYQTNKLYKVRRSARLARRNQQA